MFTEFLIKIGVAVLVGGLIGLEREYQYKAAGFRTIILITVGSTLYTLFSISIASMSDSPDSVTRIASNIVTGIGFLGAGTIIRDGGRIGGLTTAATIWLAAALGMGIGAGEISFVLAAAGVALVVLIIFPWVVAWIDAIRDARTYTIVIASSKLDKIEKLHKAFADCRLQVTDDHIKISDESITTSWRTIGSPKNQDKFMKLMIKDKDIVKLEY